MKEIKIKNISINRPLGKVLFPHVGLVPLPGRRRIRGPVLQGLLRGPRELLIVPNSAIAPEYFGCPGIGHQDLLGSVADVDPYQNKLKAIDPTLNGWGFGKNVFMGCFIF